MRIFKLFKTKKEIEHDSFCHGLLAQSKATKSMIDLCREHQKKYPMLMTDKDIVKLIESSLIIE